MRSIIEEEVCGVCGAGRDGAVSNAGVAVSGVVPFELSGPVRYFISEVEIRKYFFPYCYWVVGWTYIVYISDNFFVVVM